MAKSRNIFIPKKKKKFKKWKSISCNANGVETNLPLISYLPEWKQDKRKFEEQVAKDTKGANKLFEVYKKYEACKTISGCTRSLECEMVSHISGKLNGIFASVLKAKVIAKYVFSVYFFFPTASI